MTSYVPFVPSSIAPFQFQATLDGVIYNLTVTWNLFGQRWYVNCYTSDNALVFAVPLIGSLNATNIESITNDFGTATLTLAGPHFYPVGTSLSLVVSGAEPADYNGTFLMLVTSGTQLSYQLATNPDTTGPSTVPGSVAYNINLAAGYFTNSTLIYRDQNTQFEISP